MQLSQLAIFFTRQTERPCSGNVDACNGECCRVLKINLFVKGLPIFIHARRMFLVVPVALLLAAAGMLSVKGVRNMIVTAVSSIKSKPVVATTSTAASTIVAQTPFGEWL